MSDLKVDKFIIKNVEVIGSNTEELKKEMKYRKIEKYMYERSMKEETEEGKGKLEFSKCEEYLENKEKINFTY